MEDRDLLSTARKRYATVNAIFSLTSMVRLQLTKGKKPYASFVDFRAVFDVIYGHSLFMKLDDTGFSANMVEDLRCIYGDTVAAVWDGQGRSD